MFTFVHKMRKPYAKVTQIWNEYKKEMSEWAHNDPESYMWHLHFFHFTQVVT